MGLECAGEESGGVEGAGGFVFVLEVDVDVAVTGEEGEALGEGVDLVRGVTGVAAEAEGGVSGSGVDLGCGEVVGFSDAEGCVVPTEDVVDLFA